MGKRAVPSPRGTVLGRNPATLLAELVSRGFLSWAQSHELESVRVALAASLPAGSHVRAVMRVENVVSTAAYSAVQESLGPERLLWHGTSWDSVANIARNGFNRAYAFGGKHGARLGRGSYFAEDPCYALRFCGRGSPRALFLAGVLVGQYTRGEEGLIEPPVVDATGLRYDSTVDSVTRPRVFCIFRDFQALPLYLAEVA